MPFNFGGGENEAKSLHPDFVRAEDGTLEFRDDIDVDQPRRDFNRMSADPARWDAFYAQVARDQGELDPWVQQQVAGKIYGQGMDPYSGYQEYQHEVRRLQRDLGKDNPITGRDVAKMSLAEYDALFDDSGRPRAGVEYRALPGRDVDLADHGGIDASTARELRRRQA